MARHEAPSGYTIGQAVDPATGQDFTGQDYARPVWHALQVLPRKEATARDALKAKGIHACFPDYETCWKAHGKTLCRRYPAIPGVIYAKFLGEPKWHVLKARRLISGVFSRNGIPIAIPGDVIRGVMGLPTEAEKLEAAREEMRRKQREANMPREGERARIAEGPLAGMLVDVERVKDGRVWFSTIMGGLKGEARGDGMERISV